MKYRNMIALGAMALALAACGDDEDKKNKPNEPTNKPSTQEENFSKVPDELVGKLKEQSVYVLDQDVQTQDKKLAKGEKLPLKLGFPPDHSSMVMGKVGDKSVMYAAFGKSFGGAVAKTVIGEKGKWESLKVVNRSFGLRSKIEDIAPLHAKGAVANYKGISFAYGGDGKHATGGFDYKVDFGKKTGEGKITGIKSLMTKAGPLEGFDGLTLKGQLGPEDVDGQKMPHSFGKATLDAVRAGQGKAEEKTADKKPEPKTDAQHTAKDVSFDYKLSFFGNKGNEIAGAVVLDENYDIVVSGVRQNEPAK